MKKFITIIIYLFILEYCHGQTFLNSSLELWSSPTICETNTPPDGWSNYSNVGNGPDEGNLILCPSTIPPIAAAGDIYARCLAGNSSSGEGMFQNVSGFIIGENYTIEFDYCGSNRWGGSGDCIWHLFINDIDVNQTNVFSSADTIWHPNSFTFIATLNIHKIGVRAYTPAYNSGGSAAIDHFNIKQSESTGITNNSAASDISVSPNPFENFLVFRSNNQLLKTITLFDIVGQVIYRQEVLDFVSFNTEKLPSGIYFYEIVNESKILKKGKVVKG